jgi:glycosyltransferase involved in cell wall biosynthesis
VNPVNQLVEHAARDASGSGAAERMRVLMVAPTPFFGDRGCHVRILEEIRALRGHGVDVLVTTYHVGRDLAEVATVRTPRLPWVRRLPIGFSVHKPYLDLLLLRTAAVAGRRFRPHLVHGHLHEGAWLVTRLGRRLGVPAVADLQGSLTGELIDHRTLPARGPLPWLARRVERAIVRGPARVLASSTAFARALETEWRVPRERIVALPDGVDPAVFRPGLPTDDLRRRLGLDGKRVVVFLGVLTPYQGVDDLLAAWPAVVRAAPDAHLLLMGYPNEARYRAAVAAAGLTGSVTVTGRIEYREAPRHLALGDVAVSAKRSTTEANGKLLNYMATGLATVASDGPVSREILGEAGMFVPPGDVPALGRACAALLGDPGERTRRGQRLRERAVTEFGWPALAGRLVEVYRGLLVEPARA